MPHLDLILQTLCAVITAQVFFRGMYVSSLFLKYADDSSIPLIIDDNTLAVVNMTLDQNVVSGDAVYQFAVFLAGGFIAAVYTWLCYPKQSSSNKDNDGDTDTLLSSRSSDTATKILSPPLFVDTAMGVAAVLVLVGMYLTALVYTPWWIFRALRFVLLDFFGGFVCGKIIIDTTPGYFSAAAAPLIALLVISTLFNETQAEGGYRTTMIAVALMTTPLVFLVLYQWAVELWEDYPKSKQERFGSWCSTSSGSKKIRPYKAIKAGVQLIKREAKSTPDTFAGASATVLGMVVFGFVFYMPNVYVPMYMLAVGCEAADVQGLVLVTITGAVVGRLIEHLLISRGMTNVHIGAGVLAHGLAIAGFALLKMPLETCNVAYLDGAAFMVALGTFYIYSWQASMLANQLNKLGDQPSDGMVVGLVCFMGIIGTCLIQVLVDYRSTAQGIDYESVWLAMLILSSILVVPSLVSIGCTVAVSQQ